MIWRKETPHLLVSDEGYKIGKYRAGEEIFYRPSLKGDFISRPFTDLDAARLSVIGILKGVANEPYLHR